MAKVTDIQNQIAKVFGDTSVKQSDTREALEMIRDYADEMIVTLPDEDDGETD